MQSTVDVVQQTNGRSRLPEPGARADAVASLQRPTHKFDEIYSEGSDRGFTSWERARIAGTRIAKQRRWQQDAAAQ